MEENKYKIVDGVIVNPQGKQIKHYSELPFGFGHFLPPNTSLDGMVSATTFYKKEDEISLKSNKQCKDYFE